ALRSPKLENPKPNRYNYECIRLVDSILNIHAITGKLLQIDESILSVAIVDMKGQTVSRKSRYHISNAFVSDNAKTDCNIWIRAAFAMVEQCAKGFGKVETFVSIYEKIKVMVVPLMPINSLVVLTMLPSVSVEYIIRKINLIVNYFRPQRHDKNYDIESDSKWLNK
ncbi:MAG: hypothetical protein WCF97_07430, partial [Nitrososphaeraceae archaeon]